MTKITLLAAALLSSFGAFSVSAAEKFEFDLPQSAKTTKPLAAETAKTVKPATLATPAKPAAAVVVKSPVVKPPVVVLEKGKDKDVYKIQEVAKVASKKQCTPTTVAMTFHNVPTQKGPYFHRWVSLGCEADEINFVREGNEQYQLQWQLAYVPADEHQTARYALRWQVKGKDDKGAPVSYEARHTFTLDNARTLSLTNNMAVSLRRVP